MGGRAVGPGPPVSQQNMIWLLKAEAFPDVSTALTAIVFGPSPWQ